MNAKSSPLLFDLDGTLVDSGLDIAHAVNRTLDKMGIPRLPEGKIITYVGYGVRGLFHRVLSGGEKEEMEKAIQWFKEDYFRWCLVKTRPFAGIESLLKKLKSRPMGVVTNKPRGVSEKILAGLGLLDFFTALVGGDEVKKIKPDKEPILLCCQRLGVDPDMGFMIGDYVTDIESGKAAGMHTCGVLWGFDRGASFKNCQPEYVCTSVSELTRLLLSREV